MQTKENKNADLIYLCDKWDHACKFLSTKLNQDQPFIMANTLGILLYLVLQYLFDCNLYEIFIKLKIPTSALKKRYLGYCDCNILIFTRQWKFLEVICCSLILCCEYCKTPGCTLNLIYTYYAAKPVSGKAKSDWCFFKVLLDQPLIIKRIKWLLRREKNWIPLASVWRLNFLIKPGDFVLWP